MYPPVCSVTGLPNRLAMERRLASSTDCPNWIGLANVDKFAWFNHVFTHDRGDQVLKSLARIATELAPRRGVLVFRIGGDNFAFLSGEGSGAGMKELLVDLQAGVLALAIPHAVEANSETGLLTVSVAQRALPGTPIIHPGSLLTALEEKLRAQRVVGPRFAAAALGADG
jgi:diguanylate cyclase (GGDEF)-like protein